MAQLSVRLRRWRGLATATIAVGGLVVLAGCAAPAAPAGEGLAPLQDWDGIVADADGQTVNLWMYGGDDQANAYVDDVLTPAAADEGVSLNRVPIVDTKDALNRILTELQAGRTTDGSVDLVWVNGDNFRTGSEASAWRCEWTQKLPNMANVSSADPLLNSDFGTPVNGCEAPWSKAQFSIAYNSDVVTDPPTSVAGILEWAQAHPGRFTYPAPPDFTGSAFIRQVLYSEAGGHQNVPADFSQEAFDEASPDLYESLQAVAPFLWREGDTYPADSDQLDQLYADGQVDMTMTYGPASLTKLVADGVYPSGTRVLSLGEGTLGNASFLAIPANASNAEGAMVVANLSLSVDQQVAKADPAGWGQFTVLDFDALNPAQRQQFADLPQSTVVPSFDELSRNANPELSAEWVPAVNDGWRTQVAAQ
ncbi:ABC transporter substrate-binding protein [Demequina aurantiaca]|uniref:ABC transporter substrate-binding protein n=1 Tax=Demequina aurantiaca TaxID=676200 RepID=UPI003D3584DE